MVQNMNMFIVLYGTKCEHVNCPVWFQMFDIVPNVNIIVLYGTNVDIIIVLHGTKCEHFNCSVLYQM